MGNRAYVVLMCVGDDQAAERLAAGGDELWIRHLHVGAGLARAGKRDPAIDHQPTSVVAVQVEVHADLARTPKR